MDYMSHLYGRNKKKIIENSRSRIYECCDLENGKYVITEQAVFLKLCLMKKDMKSTIVEKEDLNVY